MYTNFFWDLDGTLYDTYPKMVESFVQTLKHFDIPADRDRVYQIMRQDSLGKAFDDYERESEIQRTRLEAIYYPLEKQLQHPQLFNGVRKVLEMVVESGGANFLLTHRNGSSLEFMDHDQITGLFTDFVTAEQPFPRKPDPTSLNFLIDKHQINRQDAVMVGDRNLDIEAGHNAKIAAVMFDPDDMIQVTSHPEQQVSRFTDLLPLIETRFKK